MYGSTEDSSLVGREDESSGMSLQALQANFKAAEASSSTFSGLPTAAERHSRDLEEGIELQQKAGRDGADRRHNISHFDVDGPDRIFGVVECSFGWQVLIGCLITGLLVLIIVFGASMRDWATGRHHYFGRRNFVSRYLADELGIIPHAGYARSTIEWVEDEVMHDVDEWRKILHLQQSKEQNAATTGTTLRGGGQHGSATGIAHPPIEEIHQHQGSDGSSTTSPAGGSSTAAATTAHLSQRSLANPFFPHSWSEDMPSDLDFRKRMKSRVFVNLESYSSTAEMVLPPRDLNVHGFRGISVGKFKEPDMNDKQKRNRKFLYFTLELWNQGTEPWEMTDHIALRDLDRSFFRHEILHETEQKAEERLEEEQGEERNDAQLLDDSRGMNSIPQHLLMKRRVGQFKNGEDVGDKMYEDPDVIDDDDIWGKSVKEHHHGVFGKDLSFTHGELDDYDPSTSDHKLHLMHDLGRIVSRDPESFFSLVGVEYTSQGGNVVADDLATFGSPGMSGIQNPFTGQKEAGIAVDQMLHPGEAIKWKLRVNFAAKDAMQNVRRKFAFSTVDWLEDPKNQDCREDDDGKRWCTGRKHPVLRNFGPVIVIEAQPVGEE
ncbi:unnamed protein product [Amoebophrya sp. A25]|nr:unnamed protein product [Amoebophrya sp. A25]|eukprot:GSA25T00001885001.1